MPFKAYLSELQRNLKGPATERTYYPALKTLLENLGPRVDVFTEAGHIDVGHPDFEIRRPERAADFPIGWVEAKQPGGDLDKIEKTDQLKRYSRLHNLVLTDFVEFRWFREGKRILTARLGELHDARLRADPKAEAEVRQLLERFLTWDFAPPRTPKELALSMAGLAHVIRDITLNTFNAEPATGELHTEYEAFRATLIPDLKAEQFADMFAQTIAYGLFAAACQPHPATEAFTREKAAYLIPKTNPFLRRFFGRIAGPELDERIRPFVDHLAALLDKADLQGILQDFGKRTGKEDPVVHFYEDFLQAYDPKVREMRGVYYTPEPVVSYIVRSIDYLLKTRFNKPLGLADKDVLILDPACGTGTFLYFVIQHIYDTVSKQGQKGQWNSYVSENLLKRIFGFELLMAPYAVAHLKLGLLLKDLGYKFDTDERLGIYLTNTLEEAIKKSEKLFEQWIADEANAAAEIKRDKPIMVVLGNPPYSGISANRGEWITSLIEDYRKVDGKPLGEKKVWLKNDYIKFLRFAQWRIERTGHGILGFITDHSYLDSPTFRGMRQNLMRSFGELYILNLHGNAKRREIPPQGGKDKNVFDITQGTAIAIYSRGASNMVGATLYSDLWGLREVKYDYLGLTDVSKTKWKGIAPGSPFFSFVPVEYSKQAEYAGAYSVNDIFLVASNGVQTSRDALVVAFSGESLLKRIESFADPEKSVPEVRREFFGEKSVGDYAPGDTREWKLGEAQEALRMSTSWRNSVSSYAYRPFDDRVLLYLDFMVDWPREEVMCHLRRPNQALCIGRAGLVASGTWNLVFCSKQICDHNLFYRGSSLNFPLYVYPAVGEKPGQTELDVEKSPWPAGASGRRPNVNPAFVAELEKRLGLRFIPDAAVLGRGGLGPPAHGEPVRGETAGAQRAPLPDAFGPEDVFNYIYAVFHSPTYRSRYAEFLKIDFPRVPLTSDKKLFAVLVEKGAELVSLHLMESLKLGQFITKYEQPGEHVVEKVRYVEPSPAQGINSGRLYINSATVAAMSSSPSSAKSPVGTPALQGGQYFEGVPKEVWEFHIGGYQVCEKWLKDRKGRKLSSNDIDHYQKVVVALNETLRLMREIDEIIPGWPLP